LGKKLVLKTACPIGDRQGLAITWLRPVFFKRQFSITKQPIKYGRHMEKISRETDRFDGCLTDQDVPLPLIDPGM
jgi:hypothetical protein